MEAPLLATNTSLAARAAVLHNLAQNYVTEGLGKKNFESIPYADDVVLRAPLCPGGVANPVYGKENVRSTWWAPLPGLLGQVEVLDTFINKDLSAVAIEFHCEILLNPPVLLRIIDRFKVNDDGMITDQENFFDPRIVTNPAY
ncbi:hypothetical protein Q0590_27335 [Rhodocytophaga aerolata]|uniref:Nuclear transport factor 2 family protein n=1 Tax=Rhodocytophaga aerolata TaxID=455078 RepID=A0ABT8RFB6_9BACT|nr:hypothetical protein [Rhodocytophaga aerolata]MDO1450024.1 hypothetical protein [Rhodocytophaga aerolata]